MIKSLLPITLITIFSVLTYSCSPDDDDSSSSSVIQTPTPETDANQYTLTVSAGEGGSVSTEGGNYVEGTKVTVTANPEEGYGFAGWTNFESNSSTITITINSNTSVSASFVRLPSLSMVSSSTSIFTKSKKDTLTFEANVSGGFNKLEINSDNGDVEIVSLPDIGATTGEIKLTYNPQSIVNVDYTITIAGYDDISVSIFDSYENNSSNDIRVITQPEPIYKDYLKPSHDLSISRNRSDINRIRYINQRDNLIENWCNGVYENFNLNGNNPLFDHLSGVTYADVNGDGYDDIFLHPTFQDGAGGFTLFPVEYELYLYEDGAYVFTEINWGGIDPPKVHLSRKIIVGDYDNDGDPDFYSANFGLDIPPYSGEYNSFIINNYNIDGTLGYKVHEFANGAHEASSADVDGDGDLDIFSKGSKDKSPQNGYSSKFFENQGAFNFPIWADRMDPQNGSRNSYWRSTFHSELIDVDKDGNIDLLVMGHEWDSLYDWCQNGADGNCGRGKIYWGDDEGKYSEERKSLIPIVRNFGTSTDFDIIDIEMDGTNEIIITRTGGDIDSFPIEGENPNVNIGVSNYYGGHFIQICKIDTDRNIIDYTDQLIESNKLSSPNDFCQNRESRWIVQTRVEDYDGNGKLDIFNSLVDHFYLHRWEWSGSRFVKISP